MNIGIDVRKLRDYGIGTHIENVVLPAARLATGHKFLLYADSRDIREDAPHLRWVAETTGKYSIAEHFSLPKKAEEDSVRLFHSPHYTLPLRLKCRTVVTVHDLIHLKFREFFPAWKVRAAEFLLRKVLKKADLIITVSETSRGDLLEFFPECQNKTEVVYNRLSDSWNLPAETIDLCAAGIPRDYILYAGNFKKHKGLDTLLDAYALLREAPALLLVGNRGGMSEELRARVWNLPRVRMMGFADKRFLQNLYAKCMFFVFPSLYEGFGYPPLEAMACGAPVLSSDAPALKEVLGGAAAYFPRGNAEELAGALKRLIDDTALCKSLSEAGHGRVVRFQTDESVVRLLAIYESFASGKRP